MGYLPKYFKNFVIYNNSLSTNLVFFTIEITIKIVSLTFFNYFYDFVKIIAVLNEVIDVNKTADKVNIY